jgi:hypothetical protein
MAFVRFPARQVQWSRPQSFFASSNRVERGFCSRCGTPLSYREVDGPNISLTLNSLDDPESVRPELSFSANAQVSWCRVLSDLQNWEMDLTGTPGFSNFQRSGS